MLIPKLPDFYVDDIIKTALAEDINYIDVATDSLFTSDVRGAAEFIAKESGVLAGIDIALRVFSALNADIVTTALFADGERVARGDVIASIRGGTAAMLKAERTALNLLQHMSGIATLTRACADAVAGTRAVIADTRKTLPGLRGLQKYAVLCGGGSNHRFNLSQAAMLKDNHIDACGGIAHAVAAVRQCAGHTVAVEVEVRDSEQLRQAIEAGADIVMLDNMSVEAMREAVNRVVESAKTSGIRPKLEASGNITLENIAAVADTGVDIISIGALTHSVKAMDISMKWK
ncbi:MAG: carboxylating nicotinate-nucleotide diphosphorylase [Oscillospiraceae bacterium]|nr:carboxylating nicotinate-nucleotide diphosphorylase [Oscillospiraceae bacterium]